ncbi:hypothetical protein K504DRAFT_332954, partial [Pleomassaria siparia CBS 279.74]
TSRIDVKNTSDLIPVGAIRKAVVGTKDETILRILVQNSKTNKESELHFQKLIYDRIDWNSAEDIAAINSWISQIWFRGGNKSKTVVRWHRDEELWIELFHHLLVIAALDRNIARLTTTDVMHAFNDFFVDRVLKDKNGADLPPRDVREKDAFKAKIGRLATTTRWRVNGLIEINLEYKNLGRGAPQEYIPAITSSMLEHFKKTAEFMQSRKMTTERQDSKDLEHWISFLRKLP